jgi:IS5 family transposase
MGGENSTTTTGDYWKTTDGHTLAEQLEQAAILMQDTGQSPATAFVDLGYRGVQDMNPGVRIVHRGKKKRLNEQELGQLPRRQAIEPVIGHLKADHRMGRCPLKGQQGDRLHAVLCAAGYNIRWLLRAIARRIARHGLKAFLRLVRASVWAQFRRVLDALPALRQPRRSEFASA